MLANLPDDDEATTPALLLLEGIGAAEMLSNNSPWRREEIPPQGSVPKAIVLKSHNHPSTCTHPLLPQEECAVLDAATAG